MSLEPEWALNQKTEKWNWIVMATDLKIRQVNKNIILIFYKLLQERFGGSGLGFLDEALAEMDWESECKWSRYLW